jgi:hypothetical protein
MRAHWKLRSSATRSFSGPSNLTWWPKWRKLGRSKWMEPGIFFTVWEQITLFFRTLWGRHSDCLSQILSDYFMTERDAASVRAPFGD